MGLVGLLFVISFFLPAIEISFNFLGEKSSETEMGYVCALVVANLHPEYSISYHSILDVLYFGLFNITNLGTPVLIAIKILAPRKYISMWFKVGYTILLTHTSSLWFWTSVTGELDILIIGYYIWFFCILITCIFTWLPLRKVV